MQSNRWLVLPLHSCPANIARRLGDVPHPAVWVVILFVSWICDFEILDLEAGDVIHGDFKIHWDRANLLPALCSRRLFKCDLRNHIVLDASLEFLNSPFCLLFRWLEFICLTLHSLWKLKRHIGCRSWHWELQDNLRCEVVLRELRPHLYSELELILRYLVDERVNAERCRVLTIDTVVHYEKFAVWRLNGDCFHCLEVADVHALVEVAVIEDHTAHVASCWFSHLEVVVEDKPQFWVADEVTLHLNDSVYGRIDHHAVRIEQHCQLFEDVYEDFVWLFLVFLSV